MSQDSRTENPSCDSVASPLPRNPATPQPTKEEDNNNNENITIITAPLQPPGSEGQHPLSGQRLVFQSGGNSSFGATCMERRDDSGDSPAPRSASSHLSQLMQAITEENEEEPTNPPLSRDAATLPLQYEEESNPLGEEKSYLFVDNHDGTGYLSATQRLDDGSLALGETVMLARLESSTMTRGSPLPRDFQSPLPHQDRLQQYTEGETEEAERQLDREPVTRAAAPSRAEQSFSLCRLPADGSVCFDQTILLGQSFAEMGSPLPRSMASPAALEGSVWREGAPDPVRVIPAPSSEMNLADLPAAGWAPVYMNCWQSPDFHRRASDYEFQDGSPIPNAPVKEERKGSDSDSDDELFTKTTTRREGSVSRLSMSFSLADRSMQSPLPVDHSIVQNINRRLSMSSSTLWNAPNQRFGQSFIGVPSTPLNQSTRSSAWGSPNLHRTDASPLPTAPEETMPNERESSPSRCSAADSSVRPSTLMTSMSFQRSRQTEGAVFDNSNSIPLSASVVSGARWQVTNSRRTSDATTYTSLGASQQHFSGESQRSKMTTSFRTTYCRKAAAVDGLPLTRGALGQSTRGSLASSQKPRQLHQDPHKKAKKKETTPTRRTNTTTDQPDTSVFLPWSPLTITPDCSVNFLNSTVATEPPSPAPKTKEEEVPSVPASFNGSAGGVFEGFLRDAVSSMTGDQRPSTSISTTSTTEGLFSAEALRAMQQMSADGNVQLASFLQESMFSSYRRSGAPGRPSHVSEQSMMMGATMNQYSMSMAASTATHTEEPEPTAVVADENSNARRTVSSKRQPSLQQRASTNIVVPLSEKVTPSVTEELEYMTVDEQESVGI